MDNSFPTEHDDGTLDVVLCRKCGHEQLHSNHVPNPPGKIKSDFHLFEFGYIPNVVENKQSSRQQDAVTLIRFAINAGERGFTCDEWEVKSGKLHQSASARVFDLASARIILLTKDKRLTRCKRKAGVYRIDPEIGSEKEAYSRFLKWTAASPRSRSRSEQAVLEAAREYVKAYRTIGDRLETYEYDILHRLKDIILKELV